MKGIYIMIPKYMTLLICISCVFLTAQPYDWLETEKGFALFKESLKDVDTPFAESLKKSQNIEEARVVVDEITHISSFERKNDIVRQLDLLEQSVTKILSDEAADQVCKLLFDTFQSNLISPYVRSDSPEQAMINQQGGYAAYCTQHFIEKLKTLSLAEQKIFLVHFYIQKLLSDNSVTSISELFNKARSEVMQPTNSHLFLSDETQHQIMLLMPLVGYGLLKNDALFQGFLDANGISMYFDTLFKSTKELEEYVMDYVWASLPLIINRLE